MKRLGLVVAMFVFVATVGFAQSASKGVSFDQLSRYLQLQSNQIEQVSKINSYFVDQLGGELSAATLGNSEDSAKVENALLANLKMMEKVLTEEQYQKYVKLINVTRKNNEIATSNAVLEDRLASGGK